MIENTTSLGICFICDYFYNEANIVSDYGFWLIVAQSLVQTSIKNTLLNGSLKIVKIAIVLDHVHISGIRIMTVGLYGVKQTFEISMMQD